MADKRKKRAVVQPDPAESLALGIDPQEQARLALIAEVKEAEDKLIEAAEAGIDVEDDTQWILREKRIDRTVTRRFRVKLTPSMCTVEGCCFDAAESLGFKNGWGAAPVDQQFDQMRTVGDVITQALQKHVAGAHRFRSSHIMSGAELQAFKSQSVLPEGFLKKAAAV